jgi:hypothetical protein
MATPELDPGDPVDCAEPGAPEDKVVATPTDVQYISAPNQISKNRILTRNSRWVGLVVIRLNVGISQWLVQAGYNRFDAESRLVSYGIRYDVSDRQFNRLLEQVMFQHNETCRYDGYVAQNLLPVSQNLRGGDQTSSNIEVYQGVRDNEGNRVGGKSLPPVSNVAKGLSRVQMTTARPMAWQIARTRLLLTKVDNNDSM